MKAVTPEERGQVFLAALSPTRRSQLEGSEKLDEELTEIVASAKSAWREVEIEEATFLRYVAARVPAEKAAGDLFTDDLFLACACAEGNARALAAFEEVYAPLMSAAVRHMSLDAAVVDEIKQRVRTLLFVGSAESAAKIVDYAGLGELASRCASCARPRRCSSKTINCSVSPIRRCRRSMSR
jgi:RNA polymerase sigma-70 factor (ECF subfamily)